MPSRLQQTLEAARRAVERRDRDLAYEMAKSYADTWRRLQADLARLLADPDSDPAREARLHELIVQAETEFHRWAQWAAGRIRREFPDVAAAAYEHAAALAAAMAPTGQAGEILAGAWNRMNHSALAEMVAITSPASPVMELFESLGTHAADTIASGLRQGVAQGWNPKKTARHIRDALGGDLNRALTIARTETMRAYREATRQSYLANRDIVDGWIWTAHPSTRTCAACWAMDGSRHKLDEELGSHPRCRCTMVPELKEWGDIHPALAGLDELDHPTGAERFAQLSEEEQRAILGPKRYEAYKDGRLTIDDDPDTGVVQRRDDPVWGTTRTMRPVRDIPAEAKPDRRLPRQGAVGSAMTPTAPVESVTSHTTDVIDGLHKTPPIAHYRVDGIPGVPDANGSHSRRDSHIGVDPAGPWPHLTMAHELGHAIDANALTDEARQAVLAVTAPTDVVYVLQNELIHATDPEDIKRLTYMISDDEIWSRAYAQWVATRSGDPTLMAELRKRQSHGVSGGQWSDEEFEPIGRAIDEAFRRLGWLT